MTHKLVAGRARFGARTGAGVGRTARAALALVVVGAAGISVGCGAFDDIRPGATSILQIGPRETPGEAAEMAINPYDADQRYRGTVLLANAPWGGDPVYVELYADHASDEDAGVRSAAIRALGRHGGPEHGPALVEALGDDSAMVRTEAVRSLQRIHVPDAAGSLVGRLDRDTEPEASVRAGAAHALGQFKSYEVVIALVDALDDPSLSVNARSREALGILTGQDFGFDGGAWLAWVGDTNDLFVAGRPYLYPAFERDKRWMEYLPFVPEPKTEQAAAPVGISAQGG